MIWIKHFLSNGDLMSIQRNNIIINLFVYVVCAVVIYWSKVNQWIIIDTFVPISNVVVDIISTTTAMRSGDSSKYSPSDQWNDAFIKLQEFQTEA